MNRVRLWDFESNCVLRAYPRAHCGGACDLAIKPGSESQFVTTGQVIVCVTAVQRSNRVHRQDSAVLMWDARRMSKPARKFVSLTATGNACCWSQDGNYLIVGTGSGVISAIDVRRTDTKLTERKTKTRNAVHKLRNVSQDIAVLDNSSTLLIVKPHTLLDSQVLALDYVIRDVAAVSDKLVALGSNSKPFEVVSA